MPPQAFFFKQESPFKKTFKLITKLIAYSGVLKGPTSNTQKSLDWENLP
jgi:hypothetical protein